MQSATNLVRKYWAELLLFLGGSVAYLYKLGSYRFFDGDEMIYHQVAHNINRTGNWITMYWRFNPDGSLVQWFEKPPLILWLKALLIRLPGPIEFWSRLPSALAGIGTVYVTYLIGKRLFGKTVGLIAAGIILTAPGLIHLFRIGRLDGPMVFFFWLALYFALRLKEHPKFFYLFGAAIGLSAMSKGATALLVPVIVGLAWWWNGELKTMLRNKHLWIAAGICALVAAPWHLAEIFIHGKNFWDSYFGFHVWSRIKESVITPEQAQGTILLQKKRHRTFYLRQMYHLLYPWGLLMPFGWVASMLQSFKGDKKVRWLWIAATLVIVFFSGVVTKVVHYVAPAYPALALMAAVTITDAWQRKRLVPMLGVLGAGVVALILSPYTLSSTSSQVLAAVFLTAAAGFFWLKLRQKTQALMALALTILVVSALAPFVQGYQIYKPDYVKNSQLVGNLAKRAKPGRQVLVYPLDLEVLSSFTVLAYVDQPVIETETIAEVDQALPKGSSIPAFTTSQGAKLLSSHYKVTILDTEGDFRYVNLIRK